METFTLLVILETLDLELNVMPHSIFTLVKSGEGSMDHPCIELGLDAFQQTLI
jgi:hypothetical protein